MAQYSDRDLQHAAEFREGIHKEALEKLRQTRPEISKVVDRYPVEAYFQQHWDYPGRWYTVVAVPEDSGGRKKLVDTIVRDTLAAQPAGGDGAAPGGKPYGAYERPAPRPDGGGDPADCPPDPFYALIAGCPRCVVEYCIVAGDPRRIQGGEEHRRALDQAFRKLSGDDPDGDAWHWDVSGAKGTRIDADALFAPMSPDDRLNYRRAFLAPPHGSGCTDADFARVNAALFPNGAGALEVYEWTTDWSDYFDDGHEWWGALCLTVYDRSLGRFVVILASATD